MKQIGIALPIYRKDEPKTPENIIGIKIFSMTENGRPNFSQTAFVIWRNNLDIVLLAGAEAPVMESIPYAKPSTS